MLTHKINDIEYLSFKSLNDLSIVTNIFTTRLGGVSKDYYSSMNLGFTNGDNPIDVLENYKRIASVIGVNLDHIVRSKQTHTTNVKIITSNDVYDDGQLHEPSYNDVDGLITNVPGIALATFYADCVPLYFVDPVERVIGLSHSGWRGTVKRMGEVTIKAMQDTYGCSPENIHTAIGPSICKDCYEVSEDVADEFVKQFGRDSENIVFKSSKPGKYQLDLWEANKIIMLNAGIKEDNIELAKLCTSCNSSYLYSHRASNGKRGNLAAFLMLNM